MPKCTCRIITLAAVCMLLAASPILSAVHADGPVFNGGGLNEGINQANGINGPVTGNDVRTTIVNVLKTVLNYLGLFAVIMIVVAGFYLVLSGGNEEVKEKAKKIILYVVIGLLVIIFARAIVLFVTTVIQ